MHIVSLPRDSYKFEDIAAHCSFPDFHRSMWSERSGSPSFQIERVCERARRRQQLLEEAEQRAVRALEAASRHAAAHRRERAEGRTLRKPRPTAEKRNARHRELMTIVGCVLGGAGLTLSMLALLIFWVSAP